MSIHARRSISQQFYRLHWLGEIGEMFDERRMQIFTKPLRAHPAWLPMAELCLLLAVKSGQMHE